MFKSIRFLSNKIYRIEIYRIQLKSFLRWIVMSESIVFFLERVSSLPYQDFKIKISVSTHTLLYSMLILCSLTDVLENLSPNRNQWSRISSKIHFKCIRPSFFVRCDNKDNKKFSFERKISRTIFISFSYFLFSRYWVKISL